MKLFGEIKTAFFKSRPNRFVVECVIGVKKIRAYIPNPGRLQELLFPDVRLYLDKVQPGSSGKMDYKVVAVEKDGLPVLMDTHFNNHIARILIEEDLVPSLKGAEVIRSEVAFGKSRFDFLLRDGRDDLVLEVKACTLFSGKLAMFPDAVTARGKRHLLELSSLSNNRKRTAVMFIVYSPSAEYFMPDFHTDPDFAKTLLSVKDKVDVMALSVSLDNDLALSRKVRELSIPWKVINRESDDRGSYVIILRLKRSKKISIGGLGRIQFRPGYYIYVGSAMGGLTKRVARHQKTRKNHFWHIDYLRAGAEFVASLPVRTSDDLECDIAASMKKVAEWQIDDFGASDCRCKSHLFGMIGYPLDSPVFMETLLYYRMDRLVEELEESG